MGDTPLLHGCFSRFLTCTNGTKLCKALHMAYLFLFYIQTSVLRSLGMIWVFMHYAMLREYNWKTLAFPGNAVSLRIGI